MDDAAGYLVSSSVFYVHRTTYYEWLSSYSPNIYSKYHPHLLCVVCTARQMVYLTRSFMAIGWIQLFLPS